MKLMVALLPISPSFRGATTSRARNPYPPWGVWLPALRLTAHPGMTREGIGARPSSSIRLRQAEHFLGHKTQDQLRADRGDARDQRFAQIALAMEFLGVTEA